MPTRHGPPKCSSLPCAAEHQRATTQPCAQLQPNPSLSSSSCESKACNTTRLSQLAHRAGKRVCTSPAELQQLSQELCCANMTRFSRPRSEVAGNLPVLATQTSSAAAVTPAAKSRWVCKLIQLNCTASAVLKTATAAAQAILNICLAADQQQYLLQRKRSTQQEADQDQHGTVTQEISCSALSRACCNSTPKQPATNNCRVFCCQSTNAANQPAKIERSTVKASDTKVTSN